ncbi:UvrD/REP helicase [Chthoniobacter flavus Ellin428]|uniref:DNA 3'-5' helicase n=1 Tax=Chthoniobacter flavus Ellin428 TaxID=497964 RepID=B4CU41_9BACT|nr:UvrD-helicase domain-containing protein [Chthoniobacter flavus]EDY22079.1 UvrD/REP helicase [Chthoniobacter flavus Ellin428]TCO94884.1 DNA helicase-2/ATP-dependent DNA helicase PcrA [Chthoniobacter flavus]
MSGFSLFDLNPEQEQAVRTTEGPLLILAGAGTGKTRVITMRVAFLISQGVDPSHILAVTFTNKAADEMRERLAKMIEPSQAKKVTMSTFHALCVRILRQDIEKLGWKKNFSIYDEGDQMGLIKKIITRTAAKDEKLDPNVAKNLISKAKNNGWREVSPGDEKTLAGAVFARYQAELKTLNAVDFDDLLLLAVKVLSEHADVRDRWHRRFRYLMVDEFQDTNRLQLELVSMLAKPAEGTGGRPNVAVVGDDDQSIYGWRGAEVSNILEFEAHFPDPVVVKLEQNYRSTNAILNTANFLIKNNPRRRPKKLWSSAGDGDKVRIVGMSDDRQEAEFIANEIAQRSVTESAPHEEFAILFRMNAQSRLLETNLRQLNIPYRIIGGKSFFDRREVKDLLAYANCLVNTDDDVSLLRIINTPARGISSNTVEKATDFSAKQKCSVFDVLTNEAFRGTLTKRTVESLDRFVEMLDRFETKLNTPLSDHAAVLREMMKETGYLDELKRTCKTPQEALSRETNLMDLLKSFEDYQGRSSEGLRGFLDEMSLRQEREEDDDDARGTGVTLITLHAAKGLEYPHVYLIGLEEGLLPHDRSKLEGTVDEERRLLYVGITRARRTLALSWCRHRIRYGSPMPCTPSSFIKELPPEWIIHRDATQILQAPVSEAAAKSKFGALRAAVERAAG